MYFTVVEFFPWGLYLVSSNCDPRNCLMISIFLNFFRLIWGPVMWSIFENVPCAFERNIYFASLGLKILYLSVKHTGSSVSFSATMSVLILCLEYLWIINHGVLKSMTISVLLSITLLKSSKIFVIYWGALMLGTYMFIMFIVSWWILPFRDLVSFYGLSFEIYFVWCKYGYSNFSPANWLGIFFPTL